MQAYCADSCRQRMRLTGKLGQFALGTIKETRLAELEISMQKSSKIRPELAQTNDSFCT